MLRSGWGGVFSVFPSPSPIPHRLTDGGRKVVTLTRPNKTPALQAKSDSTDDLICHELVKMNKCRLHLAVVSSFMEQNF